MENNPLSRMNCDAFEKMQLSVQTVETNFFDTYGCVPIISTISGTVQGAFAITGVICAVALQVFARLAYALGATKLFGASFTDVTHDLNQMQKIYLFGTLKGFLATCPIVGNIALGVLLHYKNETDRLCLKQEAAPAAPFAPVERGEAPLPDPVARLPTPQAEIEEQPSPIPSEAASVEIMAPQESLEEQIQVAKLKEEKSSLQEKVRELEMTIKSMALEVRKKTDVIKQQKECIRDLSSAINRQTSLRNRTPAQKTWFISLLNRFTSEQPITT